MNVIDGKITTEYSVANRGNGPIPDEAKYREILKYHDIKPSDILTADGSFKTLSTKDLNANIAKLTEGGKKPGMIEARIIDELKFQAAEGNKSKYQITVSYPLSTTSSTIDTREAKLTAASPAKDIMTALDKYPLVSDCVERKSSFQLDTAPAELKKLLALALHKTGYLNREDFQRIIDYPSLDKNLLPDTFINQLRDTISDLQKTHNIKDGDNGQKIGVGLDGKSGTLNALATELARLM